MLNIIKITRIWALSAVLTATLTGCPMLYTNMPTEESSEEASRAKSCKMYSGTCFDLTIDGQKAIPVTKEESTALSERLAPKQTRYTLGSVTRIDWRIPNPVRDGMKIEVTPNECSEQCFGDLGTDGYISLTPLDNQKINTESRFSTDPSVRAGGAAVVSKQNVIAQKKLPPGEYSVKVRINGIRRGWAEKLVHFTVVND